MKLTRFRDFPFVIAGLGSFLLLFALLLLELPADSLLLKMIATTWQLVGFGPHAAANILARTAPEIPPWLDAGLVVLLGLLPYLAADLLLARYRRRRSRS